MMIRNEELTPAPRLGDIVLHILKVHNNYDIYCFVKDSNWKSLERYGQRHGNVVSAP